MPRPRRKQKSSKQTMKIHTKNPGHVCEIEWKIDNVLKFPDQSLTSKVKLGRGCRTILNIIIKIQECENYSHLFIGYERTDERKTAIKVCFDFHLVSSKGDVYMHTKANFSPETAHKVKRFMKIKFAEPDYFNNASKVTEDEIRDPDDDILKNLVSNGLVVWDEEQVHMVYSLPEDSINLKGTVKVFACCVPLRNTPIHQSSIEDVSTEDSNTELIKNLTSAFTTEVYDGDGLFTDISLWIQGEKVRAHKLILSARSPTFKRQLLPDSEGHTVDEIVIHGIEKSDFMHFLLYLYTGCVGTLKWHTLQKLYEVAIEFEVNALLELCKNILISGLKDRRACNALLFATKHKDEELKKATIDFIKVIFYEFQKSNIWESFRNDHPGLANDVMRSILSDFK